MSIPGRFSVTRIPAPRAVGDRASEAEWRAGRNRPADGGSRRAIAPFGAINSQAILDTHFARDGVPERLVLLFDELDRYAEKDDPSAQPPGRGFFNDLEAARRDTRGLGVLATGSLGVFVVRDVLGSSFLSRAYRVHLAPFPRRQIEVLTRPFGDRGRELRSEVLETLHLATGGIPALLTYGLLLPESVLTAYLALGFELLGWTSEREAQSAAGRTDLKLRRNGSADVILLEIKIWGRNDDREAHRQIESYWTEHVRLGVVVQLSDADLPDWPERYRRECLEPLGIDRAVENRCETPIRARFSVASSSGGMAVAVDHYLLGLPRREGQAPRQDAA